jgi:hypothetical protein
LEEVANMLNVVDAPLKAPQKRKEAPPQPKKKEKKVKKQKK